jgi:hypothetical protein
MKNVKQDWPLGVKGFTGVISCLVGLGVIYYGYGIGTESPKKEATAGAKPVAQRNLGKPVNAMNFALGNMVYFARELGFSATAAQDGEIDANKIAARIENQLQGVREIYRIEVAKNPSLAGSMTLQLAVAPSGQVQQVREVSARINDGEFKRAVLAEAAKWSFADLASDHLNVICPLLFVHEGMDITSLVQWEKSMANLTAENAASTQQANAPRNSAPMIAPAKQAQAAAPKGQSHHTREIGRKRISHQVCDLVAQGAKLLVSVIDDLPYRHEGYCAAETGRLAPSTRHH